MAPHDGSIHRQPRSDSGAVRLWEWARGKRGSWTTLDAAAAADLSPRRTREIVSALHAAGLLDCDRESEVGDAGQAPAEWSLSAAGRALDHAPVMIVRQGRIVGVRAGSAAGTARLRRLVGAAKLSSREAALKLGINDRTLRRLLAGDPAIAEDDPILARAAKL